MLALLGCSHPAIGSEFSDLVETLDQIRETSGVAGASVLILNADEITHAADLGLADRASGRPMSPDTWIRIGSITKSFVGLAFLKLDADGVLPLDATLAQLNSGDLVDNPWARERPVTIAQLLEHSAGLGDMVREEWETRTPLSLADALGVAPHSRRLRWQPGVHSSYSNSGAGVAAAAMRRATGLDLEQYLVQAVARPMGMPDLTFSDSARVRDALATGYDRDGTTVLPYWHMLYRPFGGLNVPFRQLARLPRMLLGNGTLDGATVFTPQQVARMENPHTTAAARAGLTYGYGLGNYHQLHKGVLFHGHGGDADGYLTHYAYSRELGTGYCLVITAFQNATLRRMKLAVQDYLTRNAQPATRPGKPQPAALLAALAGTYAQATSRFDRGGPPAHVSVSFVDGRLVLETSGRRDHLVPLGQGLFRRRFETVATTAFTRQSGQLILQGPFGNYVQSAPPGQ